MVGIGERVQSWERSLELLRNTVESMEAAFKRVQLQFLSADSMGMGSGLAGTTQADDEYRANNPNHAQLYSQPQVRRVSQPNLQYVPPGAFETSGDESPYDPEAALGLFLASNVVCHYTMFFSMSALLLLVQRRKKRWKSTVGA